MKRVSKDMGESRLRGLYRKLRWPSIIRKVISFCLGFQVSHSFFTVSSTMVFLLVCCCTLSCILLLSSYYDIQAEKPRSIILKFNDWDTAR